MSTEYEDPVAKAKRKAKKSILKDALKPLAPNPPDADEPADPVEMASTQVIDERSEDADVRCSCRNGCPTCNFIHAIETNSLVIEEP